MTSSKSSELEEEAQSLLKTNDADVQLHKYRWWILALYSITLYANTGSWMCLFTITDATAKFYDVKVSNLLWVFNISTIVQLVTAVPASFLSSRAGLYLAMCFAAVVNAFGTIFLVIASDRDRYIFFVLGQVILAISSCLLPQLAPEISAVWFGEQERATATSIGVVMAKIGASIGFLQPALLVGNGDIDRNFPKVAHNIRVVIYTQTAICVATVALVLIFFKDKPKTPPSLSEAHHHGAGEISFAEFKTSLNILFWDRNYQLASHSYALISAALTAVPVSLNQIIAWKHPHHDATVGWMGFSGVLSGTASSILIGLVLDKTHKFKTLTLILGFASLLVWIGFCVVLEQQSDLTLPLISFVLLLILYMPIEPVLVDLMAEVTYPVSSGISYVVAIAIGRVYMILLLFLSGFFIEKRINYAFCILIAVLAVVVLLLVALINVTPKRTYAEEVKKTEDDEFVD